MRDLQKKTVLVSGAANGIGAAVTRALLAKGAFVIGVDIEPFNGSELQRNEVYTYPPKPFWFFQGDVANPFDIEAVAGRRLDGLVNNAGLLGGDASHGGRTLESWNKMMRAHAQTAFVVTELAYPLMKNGGSIVNIGSIELLMAAPEVVLYTAAKGAVWGMTVAYATTLAPMGIRVNMVSPGNVNTERNKAQYQKAEARELMEHFEARTPLKRSVEPKEVADTVLFLLSEKSSAITGQEIVVDCGYVRPLGPLVDQRGHRENIYVATARQERRFALR